MPLEKHPRQSNKDLASRIVRVNLMIDSNCRQGVITSPSRVPATLTDKRFKPQIQFEHNNCKHDL